MSGVVRNAGKMGFATFLSRIGGLAREQVFAFLFGASDVADAFNIAFRIPNLLRDLFAEGAMSAAFVPNFTKALAQSKDAAFRLLVAVTWTLFLMTAAVTVVGFVFAPELVSLYASSYKAFPGKYELTVQLTKIMFPFFPLVALAAVVMGALNALGSFFLPAFAPVLFNLTSIFIGIVVCPLLLKFTNVHPIYAMSYGVVVGGFFQFYVQWHQIRKEGLNLRTHGLGEARAWRTPWRAEGVKEVLWLVVPGTVGLAATQLNILVNSIYATDRGSGAVSWLNYAFRLMQFPIGIFGVSLAAATLPQVSRFLVSGNRRDAAAQVNSSLCMSMAVNGPAAAGLMAIGLPIVQLLFQHGSFKPGDSEQTALALFWYALGLPGYSAVKILVPVFYALKTTRVPVVTSFIAVGLNAVLNYFFIYGLHWPFWALALSTSLTSTLNALFLFYALRRILPEVWQWSLLKGLLLHGVMSVAVWAVALYSVFFVDYMVLVVVRSAGPLLREVLTHLWIVWSVKILVAMTVAIALWLFVGTRLGLSEIESVRGVIFRKLGFSVGEKR